jgi:hypothetical protein
MVLPLCGNCFFLYGGCFLLCGGDEEALDLGPTGLDLSSRFFLFLKINFLSI